MVRVLLVSSSPDAPSAYTWPRNGADVRIVQAANFVAPHSGGIKTMLRHLGAGYADAGHEVVVIVPGPVSRTFATPYGRRVEIAAPTIPATGGYRMITRWQAAEDALEAIGPDRVEVSDRFTLARAGPWARRRGVPSVVFSHERLDAILRFHLGRGIPSRRVADAWNRRLADSFDTVVCTTAWAAEEFARLGVTNLVQVPLGIDLETFHPSHRDELLRAELARGAGVVLVASVRLSPEKRPDLLIPTLAEVRRRGIDARLVICGDGPLRASMTRAAADLPVTMAGYVPDRRHLAGILASADVAIAPGPYETFGLSALEALACGTPVVASASGALPELVVADEGAVAASDPTEMAAAVAAVLARRAAARAAARRRAEQFPWIRTVTEMLHVHDLDTVARVPFR